MEPPPLSYQFGTFLCLNKNICVDICKNYCSLILFGGPYNIGSSTNKQEEPPPLSYQFSTTPPPPSTSLLTIKKVSLRGFFCRKKTYSAFGLTTIWLREHLCSTKLALSILEMELFSSFEH